MNMKATKKTVWLKKNLKATNKTVWSNLSQIGSFALGVNSSFFAALIFSSYSHCFTFITSFICVLLCGSTIVFIEVGDYFTKQFYNGLKNNNNNSEKAFKSARKQTLQYDLLKITYKRWRFIIIGIYIISGFVIYLLKSNEISEMKIRDDLKKQELIQDVYAIIEDEISIKITKKLDAFFDITNKNIDSVQTSIQMLIEKNNKIIENQNKYEYSKKSPL